MSRECLALAFFLAPYATGFGDPVVGITEQGESQPVCVAGWLQPGDLVRADTDNGHAGGRQFGQYVPHRLRVGGSAISVRYRIYEHDRCVFTSRCDQAFPNLARSSYFKIFPLALIGRLSVKITCLGTL